MFYDFANTIFYAVVVTFYLPIHLEHLTHRHIFINYGFYPSMLAAAFLAPWLGHYVGSRGTSKITVFLLTTACCFFTAALGFFSGALTLLVIFAFAQVCYQLVLVPYNNLLPSVASQRRMGFVSGLGVGIGYAGVLFSLPIAKYAVLLFGGSMDDPADCGPAYVTAAVLFFLFTLPLLLFVPESKEKGSDERLNFKDALGLLKDISCRRFMVGNFLCSDALNAVLVLIAVYLKKGLGFTGEERLNLLIVLNVSAMITGVLFGILTDRISPRRAMPLAAGLLGAAVLLTHFSHTTGQAFWIMVVLGGPGVAGLWVAGRKWVVQLAPPGKVGTLFGFYGLSNKLSLLNLTLFSLLADATGSYTCSVGVLVNSLILGIMILLSVPERGKKGS